MIRAADALRDATRRLNEAGIEDAPRDARRLLAHALGLAPDRLTLHLQDEVAAAARAAFEAAVPVVQGRFPMRLANHAGFHSAMQAPVAAEGRAKLPASMFTQPRLPLIDGRGAIWWPGATDTARLWDYTLGHQVTEPYDFTRAIRTAAHEFAPDLFVVAGPGTTLGGAVAQSLILCEWRGMRSKADFQNLQQTGPVLVSMGMDDQRKAVTKG